MQLHMDPPGDMTEGSLAGLRDEPLLHFFCPVQCSFFGRRLLFDFVSTRKLIKIVLRWANLSVSRRNHIHQKFWKIAVRERGITVPQCSSTCGTSQEKSSLAKIKRTNGRDQRSHMPHSPNRSCGKFYTKSVPGQREQRYKLDTVDN